MMKTTEHNTVHIEARVRMLESMIYRLYTNKELSTGQMNELVRIITKEDPEYFKEVEDGKVK